MPSNKHHRHTVRRMLREAADRHLDDEDIADLQDAYTEDIAPDEPGDGRIVRKHIRDDD